MENKYRRRGIVTLRGELPLDKVNNTINKISIVNKDRELRKKIKSNPSQFRGEVNKVAQDARLLNVTINKIKQQKEQLQTAINNYKNNPYIAIKFLTGLENNLEKVIKEITLKEKEKSALEQRL